MKTSNLVQVNLLKNQVKSCYLPTLPQHKELVTELRSIHSRLSYEVLSVQAEAAIQFLTVMRQYLESLCANLRSHTITSVQSNHDKVSLLLKDSFIDSFPSKDQPFIKDKLPRCKTPSDIKYCIALKSDDTISCDPKPSLNHRGCSAVKTCTLGSERLLKCLGTQTSFLLADPCKCQ
ncbi:hypothetical protein Golob_017286 [Gossypium lobatum]|uniref:Uncharacterized protein n=1 Tax=Gossypium lobatum TaxID=34289 RepID=A0A7J8M6U6_9ROSI|nr:hypothetical protein [Gossypium lobatum]